MKRSIKSILMASVIGLAALGFVATSNATPVGISSYDATNTQAAGFGGWSHSYTGTITNNFDGTVNETGGAGTLNDGLIGTSTGDTHLFLNSDNTIFDLYLSQSTYVNSISLYSFFGSNFIPGNITSLNVTINGHTGTLATTGFGPINANTGDPVHELITLTGSNLETLLTNQITLWGFVSNGSWAGYSSISEVVINEANAPTPTPEPSTMILLGTGVAALALFRKKFKRS